MKVLVACEFSGVVRRAFRAAGHDAWSCDLLPAEDGSPFHIQGDALVLLSAQKNLLKKWDLLIAHPPCQFLCNSGVRWLYNPDKSLNFDRWNDMHRAGRFFRHFLNAQIPRIAVENPIPHKYAREYTGKQTQVIQPFHFGHGETKATCLFLRNLPPLKPTDIVEGRVARVHRMPPGPDRWKERSRTFEGVAKAMASQWGGL